MKTFNPQSWRESILILTKLSDREMSARVRKQLTALVGREHTPLELYDALAEVAALPLIRTPNDDGEVGPFVKSFCDVVGHYRRPEAGAAS